MNKTKFIFFLLFSARDIIARAIDNILKNHDFCDMLNDSLPTQVMLDICETQRFSLNKWNCFLSCLHLLSYVKKNYLSVYIDLISDADDFSIMDAFVSLYKPFNSIFL